MLKAILFDLDGTLLPMDENTFVQTYFSLLCKKFVPLGYPKEEFVNAIWAGTKAMIKNNGEKTNEQVFWDFFAQTFGEEKLKDKILFDEFYVTDFLNTKSVCGDNPLAKQVVNHAKQRGLKIILASNPVFPRVGMLKRAGFVGLGESDFDYVTSYENSSFSKPNPNYYAQILQNNGLSSDQVILFGNSEAEDCVPASSLGIRCYLLGDWLTLNGETPAFPRASFEQVCQVIDQNIKDMQ